MAKQCGPIYLTGTIGGITYYQLNGEYYARLKSSLEGKRVKADRKFSNTMRNAHWFGQASKISSAVFRYLLTIGPERLNNKNRVDRMLQKRAVAMVRTGMEKEKIIRILTDEFMHYAFPKEKKIIKKKSKRRSNVFADTVLKKALMRKKAAKKQSRKTARSKRHLSSVEA